MMKLTSDSIVRFAVTDLMLKRSNVVRVYLNQHGIWKRSMYYEYIGTPDNEILISWEVPNDKPETATR